MRLSEYNFKCLKCSGLGELRKSSSFMNQNKESLDFDLSTWSQIKILQLFTFIPKNSIILLCKNLIFKAEKEELERSLEMK